MKRLGRIAKRPSQLHGGPLHGKYVPLSCGGTLPIRLHGYSGYYDNGNCWVDFGTMEKAYPGAVRLFAETNRVTERAKGAESILKEAAARGSVNAQQRKALEAFEQEVLLS